ncbi:MAG: hypothetical protein RLZZ416_701 [Candidatus Parcubacteria bacterium]|jgi:hypothetical protein
MRHQRLHELAKFAAGLVAGDFIAILWMWSQKMFPIMFLGIKMTTDVVAPTLIFDVALLIILIHYGWHAGRTPMMRERAYLVTAGIVFAVVSLAHLARSFAGIDLVIAGWAVPIWLSWIGTAATAYLSYMSFRLAMRMRD